MRWKTTACYEFNGQRNHKTYQGTAESHHRSEYIVTAKATGPDQETNTAPTSPLHPRLEEISQTDGVPLLENQKQQFPSKKISALDR